MLTLLLTALCVTTTMSSHVNQQHGGHNTKRHTKQNDLFTRPLCTETAFCERNQAPAEEFHYCVDVLSVQVREEDSSISAKLYLSGETTEYSRELDLTLWFYQNGIMRTLLEEPDSGRFRISQEDLPIADEQLQHVAGFKQFVIVHDDKLIVQGLMADDYSEAFSYQMDFDHFTIRQFAGTVATLTINPVDSLYLESSNYMSMYGSDDVHKAVSLGFYFPATRLFGLPEREDTFMLKNTESNPYELFATDTFAHQPNNQQPLYGSVPYITSLDETHSASVTWVNSAHTWVSISDMDQGKYVNFVSESGALELFVFAAAANGNTNRVKKVQKNLGIVSGFVPMTPISMLGFHFCKWANVSAEMMIERNRNFTDFGFPVDVLWMDIEWAQQFSLPEGYEYFIFNPQNFTSNQIKQMNDEIEFSHRRITVIVDPHIKAAEYYRVYMDGMFLQDKQQPTGNMTNIFVRTPNMSNFYGDCWPGRSAYVDFLNENAQLWWGQQFSYTNFPGSSYLYYIWNDMNEPAVFSTDSHTMPLDMRHWKADRRFFEHRDLHNAYGALQQKSSWRGLLARDNNERRPFVLTRSFFLGSQKFGAFWTGDNNAIQAELQGSINMLLQAGISGHPYGGSDVPGFFGEVTDDLFVQFYQLGAFYPFFRAHTEINTPNREPWLQSDRVQTAIRASINQRYDFIHYLYTTFERMTHTAEPWMRPMWHEFPDQVATYEIYTQFMVGASILFAPKVIEPTQILSSLQMQEINFYLPTDEIWYNYQTKVQEPLTGVWQNRVVTDLEQGLFVLGGTTLPILQHESCFALLACIKNPITLEIYVDADGNSYGSLYLDDGETYDYTKDNGNALIKFSFEGGTLTSSFAYGDQYQLPLSQQVTKVIIYGVESAPMLVLASNLEVDFWYDTSRKAIVTSGFSMKLGQGKMIELAWN